MACVGFPWAELPNELRLAVADLLDLNDVISLSATDKASYEVCLPSTFNSVTLHSQEHMERFLESVPRAYCRYIRHLDICTKEESELQSVGTRARSEAIVSLLLASPCVEDLSIRAHGGIDKSVISSFAFLQSLKTLSIANCAEEEICPLSERLVVSIAATVPHLEHLTLDGISRSAIHSPELIGAYPIIPIVLGDDDIPDHPTLGAALNLPSLLRLSSLRTLSIQSTHLGDAQWTTTPIACQLTSLDLGSYYRESEMFNQGCTERIMAVAGPHLGEVSPTTAVSESQFSFGCPKNTPLPSLRKLTLPPLFPLDSVVDTMSSLAGSPIETLSMHCYEEDVVDYCSAIEDFLNLRVERASQLGGVFYEKLKYIDVNVAVDDDAPPSSPEVQEEAREAAKRLLEFCQDLKLSSQVAASPFPNPFTLRRGRSSSVDSLQWPSLAARCIAAEA